MCHTSRECECKEKKMIEYKKDGDKRGEYLKAWKKGNVGKEEYI